MTEGRVFICRWALRGRTYHLWVKGRPKICAEAASFDGADELLNEAICLATGDGENLRQYIPPHPTDAADPDEGPVKARLVRIAPATSVEMLNEAELFEGGVCQKCRKPLGPRSEVPIVVERVPGSADGIWLTSKARVVGGVRLQGCSVEFLDLLTATERRQLEWRPIETKARQKRRFFELLGGRVHVPFVALDNIGVSLGECELCGWRRPPFYSVEPPIPSQFVVITSLPRRMPSVLCVGPALEPQLCTTPARWARMVGQRGARQLSSADIGVVNPDAVDANPAYQRY